MRASRALNGAGENDGSAKARDIAAGDEGAAGAFDRQSGEASVRLEGVERGGDGDDRLGRQPSTEDRRS